MRPNRALLLSKRTDRLPLGTGLLVAARRPLTWLTVAVTLCVAAPAAARSDQTRFSAPTGLFTTLDYGAEPADFEAALIPNDPLYEQYQWNLRQIGAPEAWDLTVGNPD